MSLELREECQSTLNVNNLEYYHTRITKNKNLSVVGPCGKPLFTISGIQFSRIIPNKNEILYANKLLKDFLYTHKKDISSVLKNKNTLFNYSKPIKDKLYNYDMSEGYIEYRYKKDFYVGLNLNTDKTYIRVNNYREKYINLKEFKELFSMTFLKKMRAYYTLQVEFDVVEKNFEESLQKLMKCDI